jgi:hypothetical protein
VQTNVLIKEESILKNKYKLCTFKKLFVFYKNCLKTFGSHLVSERRLENPWLLFKTKWGPRANNFAVYGRRVFLYIQTFRIIYLLHLRGK